MGNALAHFAVDGEDGWLNLLLLANSSSPHRIDLLTQ